MDGHIIDRIADALNYRKSLNTIFVAISGLGAGPVQVLWIWVPRLALKL